MPRPSIKSEFIKLDPEVADLHGQARTVALAFLTNRTAQLVTDIRNKYFSGRPGLRERTGKSKARWNFHVRGKTDAAGSVGESTISSNLPADFQVAKTIKAKNRKYLAIPLDPALNEDGSKRFESPRSSRVPKNIRVYKSKDGRLFLGPTGIVRGRLRLMGAPWWKLQKSVRLPAYTKGLDSYILRRMDKIGDDVTTHLIRFLGR